MTRKEKALAYVAIALVGVGFFIILSLAVIRPMLNRAHEEQIRYEEQVKQQENIAKQALKKADSIVEKVIDKIEIDSLKHATETKLIKIKYFEKKSQLDAAYSAINTIRIDADFGAFSVREMLSDSAVQLRR